MLLVPNAALRWTPPAEQVAPESREALAGSGEAKEKATGASGPPRESAAAPDELSGRSELWLPEGEQCAAPIGAGRAERRHS